MARAPVRLWVAAGVAVSVLLAFVGWTFAVSPQRAAAAEDRLGIADAQAQNASLRARSDVLAIQLDDIDQRRAALAVKEQSLPGVNDLESLVAAFNAAAAEAGVVVEEVLAGVPIDISPQPVLEPVDTATEGAEASGVATPAPNSAADAAAAAAALAAGPALFALPVTLRVSGAPEAIEVFLALVQDQPRAILFTSLSIVPGADTVTLDGGAMLTAETRVFTSRDAIATVPTPAP